ncbi:hypothetical protein V6N12_040785 [Hibiscus sabdariffa]|uniref:Uncharacterized protein n=1 Tax=Hibiscus sabdariffa TaxID=183260 RepID=A0ABR2E6J6_9ROSI
MTLGTRYRIKAKRMKSRQPLENGRENRSIGLLWQGGISSLGERSNVSAIKRIDTTAEDNVMEAGGYSGNPQNKIISNLTVLEDDEQNNKTDSKNFNVSYQKISKSLKIRDVASPLSNPP